METRFQTSFIPKKAIGPAGPSPAAQPLHHSFSGLFMGIATILFVISLLAAGGAYLWKSYLSSAQTSYRAELATREQQFNVDLIQQLEQASAKISLAKQILAGHIAASQLFGIIGDMTIDHVRFLSLDFTAPNGPGTSATISLAGTGQSLSAIAFQSDVLGMLSQYGLQDIVENPVLSDPTLNSDGSVGFSLSATIAASALSYEKEVTGSAATSTSSAAPASAPPSAPSNP